MDQAILIPPASLAQDTLRSLVEEFVSRDGTDYGQEEFTIPEKTEQVLRMVMAGEVVVVYDAASETCNLMTAVDARRLGVDFGVLA